MTMLISMPLSILTRIRDLPPQVETVSGTLFDGRADLSGGLLLVWNTDWNKVWSGRLSAPFVLSGRETMLTGDARAGLGGVGLVATQGRATPEILALFPDAAGLECQGQAVVAIDRVLWRRSDIQAQGELRFRDLSCNFGSQKFDLPPTRVDLANEGTAARAVFSRDDGTAELFGSIRVTPDRWLRLRIEPEGAQLIPGMPSSSATELEMPF